MKYFFIIVLSCLSCTYLSGQDTAGRRRVVISMLLHQSAYKVAAAGRCAILNPSQNDQPGFRTISAIPRYCLPKGSVVCRLEEYVQLHSPFKLNIGLGGE